MTGSDRLRCGALGVTALIVLVAASCEDFPQVNPLDPHAVLTLTR